MTAPLRSRFGIVHRLEFYTPEDLVIIVRRVRIDSGHMPWTMTAHSRSRDAAAGRACCEPAVACRARVSRKSVRKVTSHRAVAN